MKESIKSLIITLFVFTFGALVWTSLGRCQVTPSENLAWDALSATDDRGKDAEVTDGTIETEWNSRTANVVGKYIEIDLGIEVGVQRVKILAGAFLETRNKPDFYIKGYRILVGPWADPGNWKVVAEQPSNTNRDVDTSTDGTWLETDDEGVPLPTIGRYVRVEIIAEDGANWVVIGEIEVYGTVKAGVDFPLGPRSFADRVVSYSPGSQVEAPYNVPENALGVPGGYVSLGWGGMLVVEFTDNMLIDQAEVEEGLDLYIYGIGSSVEPFEVFISQDGTSWISLGEVRGHPRGIDIAGYVEPGGAYRFVKLVDSDTRMSSSPSGGADIDAIGAIGSVEKRSPEITVRPDPIVFGKGSVGEAATVTVTIGNTGDAPLDVTAITSTLSEILTISETAFTVPPGDTHDITLTLMSSTAGEISGTLTITSNDPDSPTEGGVILSGFTAAVGEEFDTKVLSVFSLFQNYPNPFNPVTVIAYELPEACNVTLTVYTAIGQLVTTLVSAHQMAGHYKVAWDGSRFANGIYLYQLEAEPFSAMKHMLLLR